MAENTKIEWADHTFNPWIGCTKVSPACDHCYAEADFDKRRHVAQWGAGQPRKRTAPGTWALPAKWNKEAERLGIRYRVFCASLADVFDNEVPGQWRIELMRLILDTPHLDWLLLTKRIGNAVDMLETAFRACHAGREGWANNVLPNVWIGASICNQVEADRDIPKLLAVPAAKRFLSMEPLLGPVDLPFDRLREWNRLALLHQQPHAAARIDWVIVGGESGPAARPMHPDWARSLRDQCQRAEVPFLFKQWGEWVPHGPIPGGDEARDLRSGIVQWMIGNGREFDGHFRRGDAAVRRVGKKAAGRLLDDRTWDAVPAATNVARPAVVAEFDK